MRVVPFGSTHPTVRRHLHHVEDITRVPPHPVGHLAHRLRRYKVLAVPLATIFPGQRWNWRPRRRRSTPASKRAEEQRWHRRPRKRCTPASKRAETQRWHRRPRRSHRTPTSTFTERRKNTTNRTFPGTKKERL